MKTRIISTIGPKTQSPEIIEKIIKAGVSMARFNFSHATHDEFIRGVDIIQKIALELKKQVKIIQDLQGPRIRVGDLPTEGIMLVKDADIGLTVGQTDLLSNLITINDKELYADIKKNEPIFLANGLIELQVVEVKDKIIWCQVVRGGMLVSKTAVNVPHTKLERGGLIEKDIEDVRFALEHGIVDYIALSFVQRAEDIIRLKELIDQNNKKKRQVKIISKIERGVALKDLDRIIMNSDAVMIARGDLGIEIPVENLPIIQKHVIRHAHWHSTPVIIATQVLSSMIANHTPTRAEVSDISNAVFDGADGVMLSDETAVGQFSVEAVRTLKRVISRAEDYLEKKNLFDENCICHQDIDFPHCGACKNFMKNIK
ncbi:pyruvate kinase [Patescibacteria group bacterium]